ncbi:hypothetical protein V0288_17320 [Pannus brasiliensis CCIBt3594]|uniref:Uncharacterized protein n=1 Tax=Pannus brasiliensis CCIBt3594 TaxID=1427578 RepID=A0AAW9QX89_9CHRO
MTELLVSWRVSVEIQNLLEDEDREVFMALSEVYLEWKEATKREAREEGRQEEREERRSMIENLLRVRFGELDESFNRAIEGLLELPAIESSRLLLEASREELLARFDRAE